MKNRPGFLSRRELAAIAAGLLRPAQPLAAATPWPVEFRKKAAHQSLEPYILPGSDGFLVEKEAAEIEQWLSQTLQTRALPIDSGFEGSSPMPQWWRSVAPDVVEAEYGGGGAFADGLRRWVESLGEVRAARFSALPADRIRFEVASTQAGQLIYHVGEWQASWRDGKLHRFRPTRETRTTAREPWFADVTGTLFGGDASFQDQLARGVPYWRSRLDSACGIDVYGTNGIAAGDIDNDGWDEIYVCQPGGLPNRLYRRRSDGTFGDITEQAGLGVLDNTSSALFADFRNAGVQDLVVLASSGPLCFQNDGRGVFRHVPDAFRFERPPQGAFTGMAAADFDGDGRIDLYLCTYIYFQSEDQYRYPVPYPDARNGPPNYLFRNRGVREGLFFEDVTAASGIDENNNRYSFAAAWCDYDADGTPELYVANDFGRNNLYKYEGGRFRDIAAHTGVEDIGPGMSAAWFDYDGDGQADLYVANMWSASGQRVTRDKDFNPVAVGADAESYRRHAKGNSLYRNRGGGRFEETGPREGVESGRWAWSADGFDFDNDGTPEIYVTCGMLTNSSTTDLMSFFWRQVVAHSPVQASPAPEYEKGWNALNEWIREDYSWNGREPNIFYARRGAGFHDFSGVSGLDFADDSRAFAVTDFDGDGNADIILKSRLGPQIRALRNQCGAARNSLALDLRGTQSNRDAIGARVEVEAGGRRVTRFLAAGSGFLSQHTKRLFFGLGDSRSAERVTIHWPSGEKQELTNLEAGYRYRVTEGVRETARVAFETRQPIHGGDTVRVDNNANLDETWLLEPLPVPDRRKGPGFVLIHDGKAAVPAGVAAESVDLTKAPPETAACYALWRRYVLDWRGPLETPLLLLVDAESRVHKLYSSIPDAARLKQDLAAMSRPERARLALPYPGRYYHGQPRRNLYRFGAAFLAAGYLDQALPYLEEEVRRWPDNFKAHLAIGQVHLEAKRMGAAQRHLETALRLRPESPEVLNNLGGVEMAQQQYAKAADYFDRALRASPGLAYVLANAAEAQVRLGNASRAEELYIAALDADPRDADTADRLGLLLAQRGRSAEAKKWFQRAIELKPDHASAINNIGVLYVQLGQREDALAAFEFGLRAAPDHEMMYLNLARLHVAAGDRARAREVLERLLARKPDSIIARRALEQLGAP